MPHDGLQRTNFDQLEEGGVDVQLEQEPLLPGLPPRPRLLLGHHQPGHDAQHGHNDPLSGGWWCLHDSHPAGGVVTVSEWFCSFQPSGIFPSWLAMFHHWPLSYMKPHFVFTFGVPQVSFDKRIYNFTQFDMAKMLILFSPKVGSSWETESCWQTLQSWTRASTYFEYFEPGQV